MPDPRHVFISYSRTDTAVMLRVKQSLLDYPLPVWTDEGIAPGTTSWKRAISTAIEQAACLVCLLSPDAKNSEWVQRELDYAEAQGVPIFALMVRGNTATSVPFALIGTQFVDIQTDYAGGMNRLVPILARICGVDIHTEEIVKKFTLPSTYNDALIVFQKESLLGDPPDEYDDYPNKTPIKSKPLLEHIPALKEAPINYRQIKSVKRNRDWTPIIRVINGIEMCLVPPGCFMMGSEDGDENERPVHQRCFDKPFWIGRYPVTNLQYLVAEKAGICKPSRWAHYTSFYRPQQPVVGVDWYEAKKVASWMGMRLPTETEWEYAARGPESWVWPWGNDFVGENLVYRENSDECTAPVGSKPHGISWVGALDMSGNVWEWSATQWRDSYREPEDNDLERGSVRVLRGGSWDYDFAFARATSRFGIFTHVDPVNFGFRLVFDTVS